MDASRRERILQRWNVLQHELLPELRNEVGPLTPKLEKVIHTLEWVRIEEFTASGWCGVGRPPHERAWFERCRSLGHVPLIDHDPRGGEKEAFEPADALRYNERTVAERSNARLEDEFGGKTGRVQGGIKVISHLMFGILALSADQLMRLRR